MQHLKQHTFIAAALTTIAAIAAIVVASPNRRSFGEPMSSEGEAVLKYIFSIDAPGYPYSLVWSPDNKKLLCGISSKDGSATSLWLFDIGDGVATGHKVLDGGPTANTAIAWSPNGELIAVVEQSLVRVFAASDFHEIARRTLDAKEGQLDGVPWGNAMRSAAFAKDSSTFWIAWPSRHARARFTLAILIDARTLKVVGRYEIDPPIPGNRNEAFRTYVESTPSGPRLVALVDSFTGEKNVFQGDTAYEFAYAIDLVQRVEIFSHFQLDSQDSPFLTPWELLLSPSNRVLLALVYETSNPGVKSNIHRDRDADIYDAQTGERLLSHDFKKTALKDEAASGHYEFGFTDSVLITTSIRRSDHSHSLFVLNTQTGQTVQRLSVGQIDSRLGFSWDRRYVAASQSSDSPQILIYQLSR